uniref:NADH-ubiquinone oxidoreductase chain 2 n=1 Tax=Staphylinoidea sp. 8 KM-2017 TaxID=2219462 RepID=A0A346RI34_9COLE|nr:NADH dehydrogenase subunit 2 [Staphylinoidea sp. 8 KM-2017]
MKLSKLIFYITLILGSMISISSNSWFGMWMGLEINLLSIIPLMNNKINSSKSEASMKYFIVQALASSILLFSIIMLMKEFINNNLIMLMINTSLLTKMGAAPFHFWFPEVMDGLDWINNFIILTWQKLAPLIILTYNISNNIFIYIIIISCMIISGFMGFNQISLRKLMAYSSINHTGWMISSISYCKQSMIMYISSYSLMNLSLIMIFMMYNSFYIQHMFFSMKTLIMKFILIFNIMSLGGLPPFLGFFPKWVVIYSLMTNNHIILTFLMMMLTLITLFYYIRIIYIFMIMNSNNFNYKINSFTNKFKFYSSNMISIISLLSISLIYMF